MSIESNIESSEQSVTLRRLAIGCFMAATVMLSASCGMEFQQEEEPGSTEPLPVIIGTPLEAPSTSEVE